MTDTMTLSQFIQREDRKLQEKITRLDQEKCEAGIRIRNLRKFAYARRLLHRSNSKLWPLREHPGDFSQSLDRFLEAK
jgi:UV DNA damage repair endonuclease